MREYILAAYLNFEAPSLQMGSHLDKLGRGGLGCQIHAERRFFTRRSIDLQTTIPRVFLTHGCEFQA